MPAYAPPALPPCSILLLAGGRGQRMGGRDKGLIEWHGEPLIAHLHRLVRPLSDDLILSCNRNLTQYAAYADRLVADDDDSYPGPLAGIRAGLALARHAWLLVLPCDSPRLDLPLLQAIRQRALQNPGQPCMLRQDGHWQPLPCILPTALAPALEQAWAAGERSPRHFLEQQAAVALDCASDDPRLANLNTPELLARQD